jgi:hypothetical protein
LRREADAKEPISPVCFSGTRRVGNPLNIFLENVTPDEKAKPRSSPIIQPMAVDASTIAQDVASDQGFRLLPCFPGVRRMVSHTGQFFTLGFTRRFALQLGHFAFMSVLLFSLAIDRNPSAIPSVISGKKVFCPPGVEEGTDRG